MDENQLPHDHQDANIEAEFAKLQQLAKNIEAQRLQLIEEWINAKVLGFDSAVTDAYDRRR